VLLHLGDGPLPLAISGIRQLTPRVRAYQLHAADGRPLPTVRAGAHLDVPVQMADGKTATRRYSIASHQPEQWEIAVLREDAGTGGSQAAHAGFQIGLTLHCSQPGNQFPLHDDARPALLIAGGIGITPIRSMAHELAAAGRTFALHYAARSRHGAAYASELQAAFGERVTLHVSDEGRRLDLAALLSSAASQDAVIYVCGPARLIDGVRDAARRAGIGDDRVRFERFTAAPPRSDDRPVTLVLKRSGKVVAVAADQSLLDAVQAAGIDAPASCRTGTCGTCAVKVLAGTPDHRDSALSDAERHRAAMMCLCVSRARSSDLTIDL
jgi:hypothetical protein